VGGCDAVRSTALTTVGTRGDVAHFDASGTIIQGQTFLVQDGFVTPLTSTHADTFLADLRSTVGAERWRVWFEDSTHIRIVDDTLNVGVANLFISDYLKSHFGGHLTDCARRTLGRELPVVFHVQPDLFQRRREKNLADTAAAEEQLGVPTAPPVVAAPRPATVRPAPAATPLFTLDNFVVGACNRMAFAAARAAAQAPGKEFHPLFIHGPCGIGKTHLIQGILNALRRQANLRVACLSAEQFTNRYLTGMRTGSLDAFRHRYRNLDVLAIDDVHFLGGKPATQEEFLHTFNEFDGRGRLVILASDSHPRDLEAVQDLLVSRWVAGLVVRLTTPDLETRCRILEAKAVQMGHPMPSNVLALVAERIEGSVRDLEGALTRIIAYAALLKEPPTLDLARQALADFATTRRPVLGVDTVVDQVAKFFGVTAADVRSHRKSRLISLARQVSMVLARELTDLSFADIARLMGGKNHTTVLAACRKWTHLVRRGEEIRWTDRTDHRAMSAETLLNHLKDHLR